MRSMAVYVLALCVLAGMSACVQSEPKAVSEPSHDVPSMSVEKLNSMLDDPDLVLIDNRPEQQWKNSSYKLPGAVHHSSFEVDTWAETYSHEQTLVLYCA